MAQVRVGLLVTLFLVALPPLAGCAARPAPPVLSVIPEVVLPRGLPALPFKLALPTLDGPVGVLLLGSDQRGKEPGRSDAMMLVLVGPKTGRMAVISIPRDILAPIPGHGRGKINSALVLGGPDLAAASVERLLGLPVAYYVLTTFSNFERTVNRLGGIPVTLPTAVFDRDSGAALPKGDIRLAGNQALALARARKSVAGGDIGRAANQQRIVLGALKAHVTDLPEPRWSLYYRLLRVNTRSNVGAEAALSLVPVLQGISSSDIHTFIVPGRPGVQAGASVIFPDQAGVARIRGEARRIVGLK